MLRGLGYPGLGNQGLGSGQGYVRQGRAGVFRVLANQGLGSGQGCPTGRCGESKTAHVEETGTRDGTPGVTLDSGLQVN